MYCKLKVWLFILTGVGILMAFLTYTPGIRTYCALGTGYWNIYWLLVVLTFGLIVYRRVFK